jgi:hypothetical protein
MIQETGMVGKEDKTVVNINNDNNNDNNNRSCGARFLLLCLI